MAKETNTIPLKISTLRHLPFQSNLATAIAQRSAVSNSKFSYHRSYNHCCIVELASFDPHKHTAEEKKLEAVRTMLGLQNKKIPRLAANRTDDPKRKLILSETKDANVTMCMHRKEAVISLSSSPAMTSTFDPNIIWTTPDMRMRLIVSALTPSPTMPRLNTANEQDLPILVLWLLSICSHGAASDMVRWWHHDSPWTMRQGASAVGLPGSNSHDLVPISAITRGPMSFLYTVYETAIVSLCSGDKPIIPLRDEGLIDGIMNITLESTFIGNNALSLAENISALSTNPRIASLCHSDPAFHKQHQLIYRKLINIITTTSYESAITELRRSMHAVITNLGGSVSIPASLAATIQTGDCVQHMNKSTTSYVHVRPTKRVWKSETYEVINKQDFIIRLLKAAAYHAIIDLQELEDSTKADIATPPMVYLRIKGTHLSEVFRVIAATVPMSIYAGDDCLDKPRYIVYSYQHAHRYHTLVAMRSDVFMSHQMISFMKYTEINRDRKISPAQHTAMIDGARWERLSMFPHMMSLLLSPYLNCHYTAIVILRKWAGFKASLDPITKELVKRIKTVRELLIYKTKAIGDQSILLMILLPLLAIVDGDKLCGAHVCFDENPYAEPSVPWDTYTAKWIDIVMTSDTVDWKNIYDIARTMHYYHDNTVHETDCMAHSSEIISLQKDNTKSHPMHTASIFNRGSSKLLCDSPDSLHILSYIMMTMESRYLGIVGASALSWLDVKSMSTVTAFGVETIPMCIATRSFPIAVRIKHDRTLEYIHIDDHFYVFGNEPNEDLHVTNRFMGITEQWLHRIDLKTVGCPPSMRPPPIVATAQARPAPIKKQALSSPTAPSLKLRENKNEINHHVHTTHSTTTTIIRTTIPSIRAPLLVKVKRTRDDSSSDVPHPPVTKQRITKEHGIGEFNEYGTMTSTVNRGTLSPSS